MRHMPLIVSLVLSLTANLAAFANSDTHKTGKQLSIQEQTRKALIEYKLSKTSFYGIQLNKPLDTLPSGTRIRFDKQSGGNQYIFPDPKNAFTQITLYQTDGIVTRMKLIRQDETTYKADRFYQMVLDNTSKAYPDKIVVDSGIGTYIQFENDLDQWQEKYAEHLAVQNSDNYLSNSRRKFHYGYHEFLKSVSIDKFYGTDNKVYVTVDYITKDYLQAVDKQLLGLSLTLGRL